MDLLQEPVSPSPSTPSSGSPPPDESLNDHLSSSLITPQSSQQQQLPSPTLTKRRLVSGGTSANARDLKARKRDDGSGRRAPGQGDASGRYGREGGQKEEFIDQDLMDKLKQGELSILWISRLMTDTGP